MEEVLAPGALHIYIYIYYNWKHFMIFDMMFTCILTGFERIANVFWTDFDQFLIFECSTFHNSSKIL